MPTEHYVITVQAVRADDNKTLEEYIITETHQIPKSDETPKPSNDNNTGMHISEMINSRLWNLYQ